MGGKKKIYGVMVSWWRLGWSEEERMGVYGGRGWLQGWGVFFCFLFSVPRLPKLMCWFDLASSSQAGCSDSFEHGNILSCIAHHQSQCAACSAIRFGQPVPH